MNKFIIAFVIVFYLFVSEVLPRITAINSETKNVTLILNGCNNDKCHLYGTWKTDPITLNHILIQKDGTEIIFKMEDIQLLSVPTDM